MAELKTRENDGDVLAFLNAVPDESKRADALRMMAIMREVTGEEPRLWGDNIVGYGHYHYKYASGREGDWFLAGFSPRKANLTLYIIAGFEQFEELRARLGKHTVGKSCLYVKRLADLDEATLRELIGRSVAHMRATNP
ncbi:MAG TPA: DUF1801 domain-containing protein [Promineifilum sp.]|mgnify:FL=1|nr:DUF1801 domain-containing protein [Promineifilum sp.]